MTDWLISDPHFMHRGILYMMGRLRPNGVPFAKDEAIEEHDNLILEETNTRVDHRDRLWILGDWCWGAAEPFFARLRCRNLHFIYGNHDKVSAGKLCHTWQDTAMVKFGGQQVFLSHYPHAIWPASHYGSYHFYGHLHGEREDYFDALWPQRRSADVGVDNVRRRFGYYGPASWEQWYEYLQDRRGHDDLQFYLERQQVRNRQLGIPELDPTKGARHGTGGES